MQNRLSDLTSNPFNTNVFGMSLSDCLHWVVKSCMHHDTKKRTLESTEQFFKSENFVDPATLQFSLWCCMTAARESTCTLHAAFNYILKAKTTRHMSHAVLTPWYICSRIYKQVASFNCQTVYEFGDRFSFSCLSWSGALKLLPMVIYSASALTWTE